MFSLQTVKRTLFLSSRFRLIGYQHAILGNKYQLWNCAAENTHGMQKTCYSPLAPGPGVSRRCYRWHGGRSVVAEIELAFLEQQADWDGWAQGRLENFSCVSVADRGYLVMLRANSS